jgi:hypothetical protein
MAYYFLHSSEQQWQGVLDTTLYVINFVSDLRHVSGFLWVLPVSSTNKTDCHDITEIILKVALNTITPPKYFLLTDIKHLSYYEPVGCRGWYVTFYELVYSQTALVTTSIKQCYLTNFNFPPQCTSFEINLYLMTTCFVCSLGRSYKTGLTISFWISV